jgi:phage tail tape-measure protein
VDIETIDRDYNQLQQQAQQTAGALTNLAGKLQAAANAGNNDAREWLLDLKEVALQIRDEQSQVSSLLQSLHGFVANQFQQPQYQQPPGGYPPAGYPPAGGGMLGRFLGGGFGRAIAMGAGFGIGDDIINSIF